MADTLAASTGTKRGVLVTNHDERTEAALLDTLADEIRRQAATGRDLRLEALIERAPWSRRQLERKFRERFLTSPARFFRDCQWDAARSLMRSGKDVLSATVEAGFASPGRLHDACVARTGMTPGEVRRQGAGVAIAYAFFDTQIGPALVAATARGMCALRLCQFTGADFELEEVRRDFPQATLTEDAAAVQTYADQLVAYLDAHTDTFTPRLDILRGTTFQREVWAELQRLRPGEVVSYTEIARRIGRPQAVRAVASACASNHLAIAIPCHRVVRVGGDLSGYRWGTTWKRHLLTLEAQTARPVAERDDRAERE